MPQGKKVEYKQYSVEITPLDKFCSNYSYVIRDSEGKEIKHVQMGGDTEDKAVENALKMIDFEIELAKEGG
ncbi:MAG: hypothetical protein ACLFV2_02760 [Desulfurivibrionaceae bacterium]